MMEQRQRIGLAAMLLAVAGIIIIMIRTPEAPEAMDAAFMAGFVVLLFVGIVCLVLE